MNSQTSTANNIKQRRWFLALALAITLTPNLYIGTLPGIRLEQVLVVLFGLAAVLAHLKGRPFPVHRSLFPLLLGGFSLVILISIGNGWRAGIPVIINDFFEIYKVVVAVGIFIMAASTVTTFKDKEWALGLVHGLITVSALVSFTQFFNPGNINALYIPYIAPTQYEALMAGYTWPRVVGLTGNPNRYAYMAAFGALLGLVLALRRRNPLYLLSGLLCLTAMLMTRSRTGFLMLGVLLLVWILIEYRGVFFARRHMFGWLVLTTLGVAAFLYAMLYVFPDSLTWRLKQLFNLAASRSWQIRLRVWVDVFWLFIDHPLLGRGPAKAVPLALPVDNEWLYLMLRYGLVGVAYLVASFWIPIQKAKARLMADPAGSIYLALVAGSVVFMIPAGVFHSFQGMALLMLMGGLAWGGQRT